MLLQKIKIVLFIFFAFLISFFLPLPLAHAETNWGAAVVGEALAPGLGATYALGSVVSSLISDMTPDEIAQTLETRYHMNLPDIQNAAASSNVESSKREAPSMNLLFNPTSPKPNTPITATAVPLFFGNNSGTDMYYTWYIKRKGCETIYNTTKRYQDGLLAGEIPKTCDVDGDGRITINDWKVEAMRLIANGGFNYQRALGADSAKCAEVTAGCDALDPADPANSFEIEDCVSAKKTYCADNLYTKTRAEENIFPSSPFGGFRSTSDNDGYMAYYGGNDQSGAKTVHEDLVLELEKIRDTFPILFSSTNGGQISDETLAEYCKNENSDTPITPNENNGHCYQMAGGHDADTATLSAACLSDPTCAAASGASKATISSFYDACMLNSTCKAQCLADTACAQRKAFDNISNIASVPADYISDAITYPLAPTPNATNIAGIIPLNYVYDSTTFRYDRPETSPEYRTDNSVTPKYEFFPMAADCCQGTKLSDNSQHSLCVEEAITLSNQTVSLDPSKPRQLATVGRTSKANPKLDKLTICNNPDDLTAQLYLVEACKQNPDCSAKQDNEYIAANYCEEIQECSDLAKTIDGGFDITLRNSITFLRTVLPELIKLAKDFGEFRSKLLNIFQENNIGDFSDISSFLGDAVGDAWDIATSTGILKDIMKGDISGLIEDIGGAWKDSEDFYNEYTAKIGAFVDDLKSLIDEYFIVPHCYVHDFAEGTDFEMRQIFFSRAFGLGNGFEYIGCQHLFPWIPKQPIIVNTEGDERDGTEKTISKNWKLNLDLKNLKIHQVTGDGQFRADEEAFWHTNPQDPTTADNGNVDEANVVGLGQDKFTWNYQEGDMVGVAIEGVGMSNTKYENGAKKVMWALPKSVFNDPASDSCQIIGSNYNSGTTINGYRVKIPSAYVLGSALTSKTYNWFEYGLNGCLESNLVDPLEGGQSEKLTIALSYFPKNPLNSTDKKKPGDTLRVNSVITNTNIITDEKLANYAWEVSFSNEDKAPSNDEEWCTLPRRAIVELISKTKGRNLSTLEMNLHFYLKQGLPTSDFPDGPMEEYYTSVCGKLSEAHYLKVTVIISDNVYSTTYHEGSQSIIIPIFSSSEQIKTYNTNLQDTLGTPMDTNGDGVDEAVFGPPIITSFAPEDEIVRANCMFGPCEIAPDSIIGLEIPNTDGELFNFSWQLDDAPIERIFTDLPENKIIFAITKQVGETQTIRVNADGPKGKKVKFSKTFLVSTPSIKLFASGYDEQLASRQPGALIKPFTTVYPTATGSFYDLLTGESNPTYDLSEFNAQKDILTAVELDSNIDIFKKTMDLTWNFDEWEINNDNYSSTPNIFDEMANSYLESGEPDPKLIMPEKKNFITFTANKPVDDSYQISVSGLFAQPDAQKRALAFYWKVDPFKLTETTMTDTITITVVSPPPTETTTLINTSLKKIATLFAGFPAYLGFLTKILLLLFTLLGTAWLILSFTPKKYND